MTGKDPIKVYDARWEINDFSNQEIMRFIEAVFIYGRQLGVDTVTITRDGRLGGGSVMQIAVETALKAGFTVFLSTDPISTPQSYYLSFWASKKHPKTMGLTITASHNPADYIGLKVVAPGVEAIGLGCGPYGGFTRIRQIYHSGETLADGKGAELYLVNLTEKYVHFSMQAAGVEEGSLSDLVVVLDALNGSAGPEMYQALQRSGAAVTPLRIIPDGTFPTGSPNPTSIGKMDSAVALAGSINADLVIGTDGDGDRLVFGDARGILNAGFASIPILKRVLAGEPLSSQSLPLSGGHKVIYDPKVNPLALSEWTRLNIVPLLFGNGHSQIKEHMRRTGAVAAVEESGHYYHRLSDRGLTICAENSLLTVLLLLKAIKEKPGLMKELRVLQERVFTTGEINYQMADDETRDLALGSLLELFRKDHAVLVSETEGGIDLMGTVFTRGIDLNTGKLGSRWYSGYLRVSTNEKCVIRSYLSSGDAVLGEELEQRIRDILDSYNGKVID